MKFKDLNIKIETNNFIGDKMSVDSLLNREIKILAYKVEDSNKRPGTKCLHIQFEVNGIKYVSFLGSKRLIETIEQVPKNAFPLETTIIKQNRSYQFT